LIASPCNKICVVDPEQRHCIGCWRTLEEIAGWPSMTDEEQRAVLARLEARRAASLRRAMISARMPPTIAE
jgi:predicted Fe-S protein YdhL (DUF1289 family)